MHFGAAWLGITGLLWLQGCGSSTELAGNPVANSSNPGAPSQSLVLGTNAVSDSISADTTSGHNNGAPSSAINGSANDENAPTIVGDPNAGDPPASPVDADPNSGDPNGGDPNSGDPNSTDPNTGDPNAGGDPNDLPPYVSTEVRIGYYLSGAQAYYTYEPANASSAPVVVFLHAYNTLDPNNYSGWIDHLLAGGNIVIFPVYQDYTSLDWQYTPNAIEALHNAYATLAEPNHVAPLDSGMAIFTHSIGGVVGMNISAQAAGAGLPVPRILLMAAPGDADDVLGLPSMQMSDYSGIPADMRFMAIVGQSDTVVGSATAIELFDKLPQVPTARRMVLELKTDSHGLPPIIAQHGAATSIAGSPTIVVPPLLVSQSPGAPVTSTIDTLDYLGYWSIGDQLLAAAFSGATFALPSGGAADTVYMGHWSDNQPVTPAQILRP